MTKIYQIENNSKHSIQIILNEYDDESIVHIVLEDIPHDPYKEVKTSIIVEKHTTRDS